MDSEGFLFIEWFLRDADYGMAYVSMLGVAGGVCVCVCAGAGGAGPLAAAAAVRTEWMRGVASESAWGKATPAAEPDR
jgi:hypothetical protein